MTTTPLKSAARALSLATLVVGGFTAWAVLTHSFPQPIAAKRPVPNNNSVAKASVALPETSRGSAPPFVAEHKDSPQFEESPLPAVAATIDESSAVDFEPEDSLFPSEKPEPIIKPEPIAKSERIVKPEPFVRSQPIAKPEPITTPEPIVKSEPIAKREPIVKLELPTFDEEASPPAGTGNLFVDATPQTSDAFAPRAATPAPQPDDPLDSVAQVQTTRVATKLASLQRRVDQLAQVQLERQVNDLEEKANQLRQAQQLQQVNQLEKQLQELLELERQRRGLPKESPDELDPTRPKEKEVPEPPDTSNVQTPDSKKSGTMRAEAVEGQPERFDFEIPDVEVSEVLAMLGRQSGLNILVGKGVVGRITANLQGVSAEEALEAITKSLGYVYERDKQFVFVTTVQDAQQRKQATRKTITKVYRPRYVSVKDLQSLIAPMLTKTVGLIAVTNPTEVGLEVSRTKAGGDSLAQTDALLVVDYPEIIERVDSVFAEIDVPPAQVVIEAMILSVKLDESMKLGVNFALIDKTNKQILTSGSGALIDGMSKTPGFPGAIVPAAGPFLASTAGLKYGFIQGDITGFIEALETLTDTSVVASPNVRVLNKQRAELIIGQRLGYKTSTFNGTQSIENVNFLEVGTKLILRPFVAQDGLVRMEIHPERSDGIINDDGLPESRTTEVTSNVMVRDGTTIVIGGLIEEQVTQSQSRVPGLGALPIVGNAFKSKTGETVRTELIVLITPRVVRDYEAAAEGTTAQFENERRHEEFRNRLSPINRRNLARIEYERAAHYFEACEYAKAKHHIEESLRQNRNDLAALRLRDQIDAVNTERSGLFRWPVRFRRKPAERYHRVPSDAPYASEFIVDESLPARPQSPPAVGPADPSHVPPAPAPTDPTLPPSKAE